jgi:hypothetical protein
VAALRYPVRLQRRRRIRQWFLPVAFERFCWREYTE